MLAPPSSSPPPASSAVLPPPLDEDANRKRRRSGQWWRSASPLLLMGCVVLWVLLAAAGLAANDRERDRQGQARSRAVLIGSRRAVVPSQAPPPPPPPPQQQQQQQHKQALPTTTTPPAPLRVAVAVTVTRDGPYMDGAAVLQHSVRMANSRHTIEMVAIVHAGVVTTRPALTKLGFRIVEFPFPITSKEIRGKHLRETIDKSGCCGAQELLKLCAWQLLEYDRVLAMDMDAVWLKSLDELFERALPPGGVMFTYDHAMDNHGSKAPPVQGGFLLIRPDEATFARLVDIVREGDFRPSTGWGGSGIGWCWGGQTVQGLVSYFVNVVDETKKMGVALDHCLYNSMVSTDDCKPTDYEKVFSVHYTVCQKPWECRTGHLPLCARFLHAWWMIRDDLEAAQGLPPRGRCCGGGHSKYCPHRTYGKVQHESMKQLPMNGYTGTQHLKPGESIVVPPGDIPTHE